MTAALKLRHRPIDPKTAQAQIRAVTEAVAQGRRIRIEKGPTSKEIEQEAFGQSGGQGGGEGSNRGPR